MSLRFNLRGATAACAVAATVVSGSAVASTINQNTSWTINRSGATSTYRVVAYGDSIFAGYNGSLFSVARRAQPYASGEYLGNNVERQHRGGAPHQVGRQGRRHLQQQDHLREVVHAGLEHARGDVRDVRQRLPAGSQLRSRTRRARAATAGLDTALANCTTYMEKAMQAINTYATTAKSKIIMNIYYPGYRRGQRADQLHGLDARARR